jgi:hypothetical protein|tara:strand:- start:1872 stop:2303 length:432 start_codon:yes stop_codon:yes gene_type:complete
VKVSVFRLFKDGHQYAKRWPRHAVVAAFRETRLVPLLRLMEKWVPAIAVVNAVLHWQFLHAYWQQGLMTSLVILSMPLQLMAWFGWRANQPLPIRLRSWYWELRDKLKQSRAVLERPSTGGPTYMDLATVLQKALAVLPPEQH